MVWEQAQALALCLYLVRGGEGGGVLLFVVEEHSRVVLAGEPPAAAADQQQKRHSVHLGCGRDDPPRLQAQAGGVAVRLHAPVGGVAVHLLHRSARSAGA